MKPADAAWVYEHVILGYHDANEANWWCGPEQDEDNLRRCACQLDCHWCREGQHKRCREFLAQQVRYARRGHSADDWDGRPRQPWRPVGWGAETAIRVPAPWQSTRKRPLAVAVWLADRVCRYLCACSVCNPPQPADPPTAAAAPPLQLDLFAA